MTKVEIFGGRKVAPGMIRINPSLNSLVQILCSAEAEVYSIPHIEL